MELIKCPTLPPKTGYRIISKNGVQQYEKIQTAQDSQIAALVEQTTQYDQLIIDLTYSITLLELGVS